MLAIFKREFRSYFKGVIGPLISAIVLFFAGIYVTAINLRGGVASFEYVLSNLVIVLLLAIPILTMRSFSEEKHAKTDQLLYSLPIGVSRIVIGKYLSMLAVFAIPVAIMALYPLILGSFGAVFYKAAYAAFLGFFLLGAALISVCMFISSLTESQVISAVISIAVLFCLNLMNGLVTLIPSTSYASLVCFAILSVLISVIVYLLTKSSTISAAAFVVTLAPTIVTFIINREFFEGLFPKLISYLAVFDRFTYMTSGIFDITAIVYLVSFTVFFIYLTVQSVEKRRWS